MIRFAMFLLISLLLTGCVSPEKETAYHQITMDEAISMMAEESDYVLLDVRRALCTGGHFLALRLRFILYRYDLAMPSTLSTTPVI